MRTSSRRRLTAAAGAALLIAAVSTTQSAADPWARAVALPTGCYASQDPFAAQTSTALETLAAERDKQSGINEEIAAQVSNVANQDPMELARRMQENMMKDPQNAQKYMETMGATDPAAVTAATMHASERKMQWDTEERNFLASYQAALRTAVTPPHAKFMALRKRLGITEGWGVGESASAAVYAEYDAIKREADQAYAAFCPQWWGANGSMQAYIKRYKDYLVKERIPYEQKTDAQRTASYAMLNTPAGSYRSLVTMDAVRDYMQLANRLYEKRNDEPLCTAAACRDISGL
ncbi:MAG: hypothetical protein ACRETU_03750 [Steroidobacterales bacterium]